MLRYLRGLSKKGTIIANNGKEIELYELNVAQDEEVLNEWACHFRRQYCRDEKLPSLVSGTGLSREEWLLTFKFPSDKNPPGPSTRAGDFGEILVSDYIEYLCSYYVPRTRYFYKTNPNTSTQGSDVIGLKMGKIHKPSDELCVIEVKTRASRCNEGRNRLQEAIDDSKKDILRLGFSLAAMKERLEDNNEHENAMIVERFQNIVDTPYQTKYGAAAIYTSKMLNIEKIKSIQLPDDSEIKMLIVIQIDNLMDFIHELYRRASKC